MSDLRQAAKAARPNAALSQCFLVDEAVIQQIAEAARPQHHEMPIVEIGPGTGHLTRYLLPLTTHLSVIEADARFITNLKAMGVGCVVHDSVLNQDLIQYVSQKGVVVGNLPYHLTGPILFQLFGELSDPDYRLRQHIDKAIIMVQKEVGDRLVAAPGDSAFGQLSLAMQCWSEVASVCVVPRGCFEPIPKVDSMVLTLTPRAVPLVQPWSFEHLSRLVKLAFAHRRKTLANNLKMAGYSAPHVSAALLACGLPEAIRPQGVSLQAFSQLSDFLSEAA